MFLDRIDQMKEKDEEADFGTKEGIYVAKVEENSAAADAGLKEGDVITSVDGKKVKKMSELQEIIYGKRPGDKMSITYMSKKKSVTKTVTLKNAQGNTKVVKNRDMDILGGQFRPITESQKKNLELNSGVEVIKVDNGAMKEAGISKGFIILQANDKQIKSIDDLKAAVEAASTSREPVLYVKGIWPTGKKDYFAIDLNAE